MVQRRSLSVTHHHRSMMTRIQINLGHCRRLEDTEYNRQRKGLSERQRADECSVPLHHDKHLDARSVRWCARSIQRHEHQRNSCSTNPWSDHHRPGQIAPSPCSFCYSNDEKQSEPELDQDEQCRVQRWIRALHRQGLRFWNALICILSLDWFGSFLNEEFEQFCIDRGSALPKQIFRTSSSVKVGKITILASYFFHCGFRGAADIRSKRSCKSLHRSRNADISVAQMSPSVRSMILGVWYLFISAHIIFR